MEFAIENSGANFGVHWNRFMIEYVNDQSTIIATQNE